jgi:hypothetical protein
LLSLNAALPFTPSQRQRLKLNQAADDVLVLDAMPCLQVRKP